MVTVDAAKMDYDDYVLIIGTHKVSAIFYLTRRDLRLLRHEINKALEQKFGEAEEEVDELILALRLYWLFEEA